jgi:hypothetical protein
MGNGVDVRREAVLSWRSYCCKMMFIPIVRASDFRQLEQDDD